MTLDELLSQYMPGDDALRNIGEFFSVFSQETRIKIIILLSVSELNVNDLSKCLGLNIANAYVNEVLFSAVKATEDTEVPLSERVSRMEYKKNSYA